ncbi:hypothetical protein FZEAL_1916 [Fusarium zealandicum]|uniref:Uncharacterized protein n=1 Tax=Fusarium zealandicum TaxID=1053134 RepID=A0A8H4USH1_9HYPO|nr:hypothetical protein FZEAL_1916 [Fusarium zealandicum]
MLRFIRDPKVHNPPKEESQLLVVGAGLPRAATSSLQAAFEELGISPCLHMAEIVPHPSRLRILLEALREENPEVRQKLIRKLVHGYQSVCDFPVVPFTPDFMDMYPDVKIVLNGRPDPEVWSRSAGESFWFIFSPLFKVTGFLLESDRLWADLNVESQRFCKNKLGIDEVFSVDSYNIYYKSVRDEAKKRGKEVLEFKAEDGWEPLCKFLGRDIPDKPFPRLNEKKTFKIVTAILITRGLLSWLALGFAAWLVWTLASRFL